MCVSVCVYTCICTPRGILFWLLPVRLLCFSCFLSLEFALLSPSYSHGLHLSHVSIYTVHSPFFAPSLLPLFTFPPTHFLCLSPALPVVRNSFRSFLISPQATLVCPLLCQGCQGCHDSSQCENSNTDCSCS